MVVPRILLVDDDPALLTSLKRNLYLDYDVTTAESASDALHLLHSGEPFSVIVTDMRMPRMDGLQFIEAARKLAPEAIYLMLTGNQDIQTAIKAVNDGHVFRFLTKPCEIAEIKRALKAAAAQYELLNAEKELLQKTFVGAVNVLTDVLDALRPDVVQQSDRIDSLMRACEESLGFCGNWSYRLAARIGLVGLALEPATMQSEFQTLDPCRVASHALFDNVVEVTARLIERIPRLLPVVAILRSPQLPDGIVTPEEIAMSTPGLAALLLRVATFWTALIANEHEPAAALAKLRDAFPALPPEIADTLLASEHDHAHARPRRVALQSLTEGQVLYDDATCDDGSAILPKGTKLTPTAIEKLRLCDCQLKPIYIVETRPEAAAAMT